MTKKNKKLAFKNKKAVFPGSFDPLTNGHLDIIRRACNLFEEVNIAVVHNPDKSSLFSLEERCDLINEVLKAEKLVASVGYFSGLLVEYLKKEKSNIIIRGLRAISDFDYEAQMALINLQLGENNVETIFLMAREENSYISSSVVKQIAPYGGNISKLVPGIINRAMKRRYGSTK